MLKPYEQRFPWSLDWNLLRTFMVVVEQQSISRAADFLGLKQPTVSSALMRLESTTGHQLVERRPNRFNVTGAGKILYAECAQIFGSVSQLPALLDAEKEELTGHVGIALASHVVSPHFDRVLEKFSFEHPKITFSISVMESGEVLNRIRQNQASFGVCLLDTLPANTASKILFREYFGLYCGPRHRLFGKDQIALADLKGEASVCFQTEVEGGPLDSVVRLRKRAKLASGQRGISSNLTEVRRMIIANIGIGALPKHIAEEDVRNGLLRQLPPYSKLPAVDIHLVTNSKRKRSPPEERILEMFNSLLEENPLPLRTYSG